MPVASRIVIAGSIVRMTLGTIADSGMAIPPAQRGCSALSTGARRCSSSEDVWTSGRIQRRVLTD